VLGVTDWILLDADNVEEVKLNVAPVTVGNSDCLENGVDDTNALVADREDDNPTSDEPPKLWKDC
jgi:hypothetical protein